MIPSYKRSPRSIPFVSRPHWSRCLIAICATLCITGAQATPSDPERGRYLVEALMACDNCHTPRTSDGYVHAKRFSGGTQLFSDKDYSVRGSNISPDLETGVGAWSDAELGAAIISGVNPKGRLAPVMPSESYRALTPSDLDAVVAFLRSIPAVKSTLPPQERHGALEPRRATPGAERPFSEKDLADPIKRGLYVASLSRCMSCHSSDVDGAPDPVGHLGQGGRIFRTPAGVAVASNITSHPTKGVGAWSVDQLKRAITQGTDRDGRPLAPTMANLSKAHFSRMTEEDLDALIAWLRTVPPE
ncbi:cytochrome c [Methylocystis heyeri]|uniref:C-type cytochrome n=1 Tax=Methylocystis heyeri TaxID=391905 RepID=A0A6B8KK37_9HYPH|nr:cytochrome c [Methylocystis heyeri]QGM48027.1 c-type cytochrome [Methylocystis heyeri]